MSDYIKRETAINVLSERTRPLLGEDGSKDRYRYLQWLSNYNAIKNLPSSDVEEVVHCKDCKRYVSDGGALMVCEITGNPMTDDDYCSYGERK